MELALLSPTSLQYNAEPCRSRFCTADSTTTIAAAVQAFGGSGQR
jgi:hypothetical protein